MFRVLAKWFAKRRYIWNQEVEAATNDLHAGLSARLISEKQQRVAQLNKEADDIEQRIKNYAEIEKYGFYSCENGHEIPERPPKDPTSTIRCYACGKPTKYIRRDQMTAQEIAESDKERADAEQVIADKRAQAKAEESTIGESEKTIKFFSDLAENNRSIANKVRKL